MKHYIIVKYTEAVSDEQKVALIPEIQALFDKTTEIDGVHQVNLYPNCTPRPNRYDLMIEMVMDPEALPAYDECVWHKQWKEEYGHLLEKKAIFDCE